MTTGAARRVRVWSPRVLVAAGVVLAAVLAVLFTWPGAEPATPTTPTEVSEAWLEAFQDRDLAAAGELSCATLLPDLTPEIFDWTRLADGAWEFRSERVDGQRATVEAHGSGGLSMLFTLRQENGGWTVCDPFRSLPHR